MKISMTVPRHPSMTADTWSHMEKHNENVRKWEQRKADLEQMAEAAITWTLELCNQKEVDAQWQNIQRLREQSDRMERLLRTVHNEAMQAIDELEREEQ